VESQVRPLIAPKAMAENVVIGNEMNRTVATARVK